ncbi:MAG: hypothetical protein ACI93T_002697, partial [Porticoccaceae bacterium]
TGVTSSARVIVTRHIAATVFPGGTQFFRIVVVKMKRSFGQTDDLVRPFRPNLIDAV